MPTTVAADAMMGGLSYVWAALLGGALGLAELVARYRDRPLRVLGRGAAWLYVGVNAGASMAALLLIDLFEWNLGQTGSGRAPTQVLIAGLGSAVLFRSSLFIFKVGDENVGMGPSQVLTSLLGAADRAVDRDQAERRLRDVGEIMADVDFARAQEALVAACLAAAANVPAEEALDLRTTVQALSTSNADSGSKAFILGMLIIDIVGADVLRQAVRTLGPQINKA